MNFFLIILMGFGMGLIGFPIILWIYLLFKNTKERRRIKKLMKQNKFLIPIDPKDYDVKAWENQRYGNINIDEYKKDLDNLNFKIFKKVEIQEDNPFEDEKSDIPEDFLIKAISYLNKAKELGYNDDYIKTEFKKRNYPENLINKIFENGR